MMGPPSATHFAEIEWEKEEKKEEEKEEKEEECAISKHFFTHKTIFLDDPAHSDSLANQSKFCQKMTGSWSQDRSMPCL